MNSVLLAALNLVLFLLLSAALAQCVALAQWRGRGAGAVILWIVLCGQVWMVAQAVSFFALHSPRLLVQLWFGNWLASAVGVIVFCLIFRNQTRHLLDAARLDGLGGLGTFRHVVWPTLKPGLGMLGLVLIMATWTEFARPFVPPSRSPIGEDVPGFAIVLAASLASTLPIVGLYFFARNRFCLTGNQSA